MSQTTLTDYDFSHFSDLELGILQKKARRFLEDKDYLNAVLREIGKRNKAKNNENSSSSLE